ncbi:putative UAA transporter [Helianthus annuus]|nr:putative UAA transporter [Helianthus annuus]
MGGDGDVALRWQSRIGMVMIMGTFVYGIRYSFHEYLCSLLVAGGVSIFALAKTSSKTINKLANPNAPFGYGLCFLNLVFDGFTNATQDSISARYVLIISFNIQFRRGDRLRWFGGAG